MMLFGYISILIGFLLVICIVRDVMLERPVAKWIIVLLVFFLLFDIGIRVLTKVV